MYFNTRCRDGDNIGNDRLQLTDFESKGPVANFQAARRHVDSEFERAEQIEQRDRNTRRLLRFAKVQRRTVGSDSDRDCQIRIASHLEVEILNSNPRSRDGQRSSHHRFGAGGRSRADGDLEVLRVGLFA